MFHLAHAGSIRLMVGKRILQETEEVLKRKAPHLIGLFAQLCVEANVETGQEPDRAGLEHARSLIDYEPDAVVLAQALAANPDWLVSHDKEHFLGNPNLSGLSFKVGSPGDVISWLRSSTE